MKKLQQGFTLVEIMIVVAIIGILAAIAIPNFVKNRNESQKKACVSNMRQISTACENWLTAHDMDVTGWSYPGSIVGTDNYIKQEPKCPTGNSAYTVTVTVDGATVECANKTSKEHYLPENKPASTGGTGGTGGNG